MQRAGRSLLEVGAGHGDGHMGAPERVEQSPLHGCKRYVTLRPDPSNSSDGNATAERQSCLDHFLPRGRERVAELAILFIQRHHPYRTYRDESVSTNSVLTTSHVPRQKGWKLLGRRRPVVEMC